MAFIFALKVSISLRKTSFLEEIKKETNDTLSDVS